jgi:hypothetical protein
MAAFVTRNNGYTSAAVMATAMINDLQANGFVLKYVNLGTVSDVSPNITATKATLQAGPTVDPLSITQPWRIMIDAVTLSTSINVWLGTSTQLANGSGTTTGAFNIVIANVAILGALLLDNYNIAVSPRGLVIYCYNSQSDYGSYGLIACQRLVNRATGAVLTTAHSPVVAMGITGILAPIMLNCSIIREDDVLIPTTALSISGTPTLRATFSVNMSTSPPPQCDYANEYLIFNMGGFAASRGLYLEEFDMLMWTNGAPYLSHVNQTLLAYGDNRTYFLTKNNNASTGCRFLILQSGGGMP